MGTTISARDAVTVAAEIGVDVDAVRKAGGLVHAAAHLVQHVADLLCLNDRIEPHGVRKHVQESTATALLELTNVGESLRMIQRCMETADPSLVGAARRGAAFADKITGKHVEERERAAAKQAARVTAFKTAFHQHGAEGSYDTAVVAGLVAVDKLATEGW